MTIHIIGDSTAANKLDTKRPEHGWGEFLKDFLTDDVKVLNHAKNGESSKSFKDRQLFLNASKHFNKGDYLIIQFGHNDSKIIDPEKYTLPYKTYQEYINYYVFQAHLHGVTPIIFSSISRRFFISEKKMQKNTINEYPKAALSLAKNLKVKHIDIYKKTVDLYNYLGDSLSKRMFMHLNKNEFENYPNGLVDNTHLKANGAKIIASIVALSLYKSKQTKEIKHIFLKEKFLRKIDIKRMLK
ncbi:rhamnogalacturonan acetylesterase [Acholeplasma granularum]|uniref:rhamnogalacturonan acetylesterase n=1 Tax=Acholeplasma granularum TaxID=264635 RepID=UPI0004B3AE83|nr:rhamnogalacturonan acetylesterase [Acholeplasma granularum]